MALDIVVSDNSEKEVAPVDNDKALVSWVTKTIAPWEDFVKNNYTKKWHEYYRLWRGIWTNDDKLRDSERSRLISPALQQAIEASVAEIEEATFGKGRWFDVTDDTLDQNAQDIEPFRDLLLWELDDAGVKASISEIFLNGALYGTGIGKVIVEKVSEKKVVAKAIADGLGVYEAGVEEKPVVRVSLEPVSPHHFLIDPLARSIEESVGCAHVIIMPMHAVKEKMESKVYNTVPLTSFDDPSIENFAAKGEARSASLANKVKIVEYHGLVPKDLLEPEVGEGEELVEFDFGAQTSDEVEINYNDMVEAIVTVANDKHILKAVRNPVMMEDRAFVAFQYDTVPNRFWGRGIAEKGYNPQKALDAELRARIDAMALTVHPMMAVDGSRMPRGGNVSIQPGRTVITNGDPNTVLRPFNFGAVNPTTFHQSGELERMIQMGTGAMDSATPTSISPRNNTASGMSMIASGAIKRSKRTLANIERKFVVPLVTKAAWRYMQYDPERFPTVDVKFKVTSTLGMMAREIEQQQLTNLLQTTQPGTPAYWMVLKSIYENSSISDREAMVALTDQMLQQSLQPQEPSIADKLEAEKIKVTMQNNKQRAEADMTRAKADMTRAMVELQKLDATKAKIVADALLAQSKAKATEAGIGLEQISTLLDAVSSAKSLGAENEREGSTETNQGDAGVLGMAEEPIE